jgi:hypothetical protein
MTHKCSPKRKEPYVEEEPSRSSKRTRNLANIKVQFNGMKVDLWHIEAGWTQATCGVTGQCFQKPVKHLSKQ